MQCEYVTPPTRNTKRPSHAVKNEMELYEHRNIEGWNRI